MAWSWAALMPHPPIIVPEVGHGRENEASATLSGTKQLCDAVRKRNQASLPEALLLLSPHQPYRPGVIYLNSAPQSQGNLVRFGAPKVGSTLHTPLKELQDLTVAFSKAGIPFVSDAAPDITADHATLVPLHFLEATFPEGKLPPVILANPSGLSLDKAVELGKFLRGYTENKRWALLASGDLSHRLTPGAPSGHHPDGEVFDKAVVEALKKGDPSILTSLTPSVLKNAGECGLRPSLILLGLCQTPLEVFSYEGPFGVGYCNAFWIGDSQPENTKTMTAGTAGADGEDAPRKASDTKTDAATDGKGKADGKDKADSKGKADAEKEDSSSEADSKLGTGKESGDKKGVQNDAPARGGKTALKSRLGGIKLIPDRPVTKPDLQQQASLLAIKHASQGAKGAAARIIPEYDHPYAHLARKTIAAHLLGTPLPGEEEIKALSDVEALWKVQKGCFVSIKNKDGTLRGCIGTFGPTRPDIAQEIIQNAVSAATKDFRFPPMKADEVDKVTISVDVLNTPERLLDSMELNPSVWGVIVSSGMRRGLLLPDLPTVTSVEQQLGIAAQKGGISNLDEAEIYRFTISRHLEDKSEESA